MTIIEFQKKLIGDGVSPKMASHIAGAAKEIYRLYNAGFALHEAGKTEEAKRAAPPGIRVITPGTPTNRQRINNTSYREHWERAGE